MLDSVGLRRVYGVKHKVDDKLVGTLGLNSTIILRPSQYTKELRLALPQDSKNNALTKHPYASPDTDKIEREERTKILKLVVKICF